MRTFYKYVAVVVFVNCLFTLVLLTHLEQLHYKRTLKNLLKNMHIHVFVAKYFCIDNILQMRRAESNDVSCKFVSTLQMIMLLWQFFNRRRWCKLDTNCEFLQEINGWRCCCVVKCCNMRWATNGSVFVCLQQHVFTTTWLLVYLEQLYHKKKLKSTLKNMYINVFVEKYFYIYNILQM